MRCLEHPHPPPVTIDREDQLPPNAMHGARLQRRLVLVLPQRAEPFALAYRSASVVVAASLEPTNRSSSCAPRLFPVELRDGFVEQLPENLDSLTVCIGGCAVRVQHRLHRSQKHVGICSCVTIEFEPQETFVETMPRRLDVGGAAPSPDRRPISSGIAYPRLSLCCLLHPRRRIDRQARQP
jgi:hypothetical protein